MWSDRRLNGPWVYRCAIAFVLLFWLAHLMALPLEITYDGLGYIDLSDVLGSSRFPADWNSTRTPLFPVSLKVAFWVLGRHATTAIFVPAVYALAGILLLGISVRRVAGNLAASTAMVLASLFPTLIAYEHCVLTESGSFFFVALVLSILLWRPKRLWVWTVSLTLALAVGYYWRQNILTLVPIAAVVSVAIIGGQFREVFRKAWSARRISSLYPAWPVLPHVLCVLIGPFLLSSFWSPYLHSAALRDTTLKQGTLRQALLPPEDPFVGPYRDDYYAAIRASLYHRNFISGMRWGLLTELGEKIWARPMPEPVPQFFGNLIKENPGRYLNGLGRTLVFFAGWNGAESDNRIYRDQILSGAMAGALISAGPEPLRSRIAHDFEQRTTPCVVGSLIRGFIPVYEPLLIAASFITVLGLLIAIVRRDLLLFTFCAIPVIYALGYAVLLVSLDRFMVPVYPISLANTIIVPLLAYRSFARPAKGNEFSGKVHLSRAHPAGEGQR